MVFNDNFSLNDNLLLLPLTVLARLNWLWPSNKYGKWPSNPLHSDWQDLISVFIDKTFSCKFIIDDINIPIILSIIQKQSQERNDISVVSGGSFKQGLQEF